MFTEKEFNIIYKNYWQRKKILSTDRVHFPLISWFNDKKLCPLDELFLEQIKKGHSVLDIGAGDMYLKKKLQENGYSGSYETMDVGTEFEYTYSSLKDINDQYDHILLIGVLEHLPLPMGLEYLMDILNLLKPKGQLILQVPNARCIRDPLGWDMTHVHNYNGKDLYAYTKSLGYEPKGFRVEMISKNQSLVKKIQSFFSRFLITKLIGADYADGIVLMIQKPEGI